MPRPEKRKVQPYEGKASNTPEKMYCHFETKEVKEDEEYYYIEGYASKFGEVDAYLDTIAPGAYTDTIAEMNKTNRPLKMLYQHRSDMPIGVFTELKEDTYGLFVKGKMPKASKIVTDEIVPQIKCGSIDSMSIGYYAQEWEYDSETDIRTLKKIKLRETSLVTFPADEFAVITNLKSAIPDQIDIKSKEGAFNARIEIMKSGAEQEVKDELSAIYADFELESPFEKNAKLTAVEIKHLTKSNLVWALKNIELSTNAANLIAESVKGTTDSEVDDSKGETEETVEEKNNEHIDALKSLNSLINKE